MKPVELQEPVHPAAEEEAMKRLSLLDAIKAEIDLMREASKTEGLNPVDKTCAKLIALSLSNIVDRWEHGHTVEFNHEEKRFIVRR